MCAIYLPVVEQGIPYMRNKSSLLILLLIFRLLNLLLIEKEGLQSSTVMMGLSTSPCISISFALYVYGAMLLGAYKFRISSG